MSEFFIDKVGLKIGLEIHQQLATNKKLFCNCTPAESDEYLIKFQRRLRASKSELGEFDPAALFEKSKSKTIMYYANPQSSCLVEYDEEPPHELDEEAKKISLVIASALKSNIFSEIYPMRKTVVDGSNTTGFQRTMLVSQGGSYEVDGEKIGIQSICLEEDAAKILGDEGSVRRYGLERLGVPLVEIATEPFEASPKQIKKIALSLGRILRSTKKVRRGLGSIRQDVNVSIREGRGVVIEVKGVQQLDQLEKIVEYEAKRQYGLLQISKELQDRKFGDHNKRIDATDMVRTWNSQTVRKSVEKNHRIDLIIFRNLSGIFGKEWMPGIRLGKDIAELVKFFGLGGIFHSDELPAFGIKQNDVDDLREKYDISDGDAFLLLAAPSEKADMVIDQILSRMRQIRDGGIPIDTRLATQAGETKFLRPRPGAARMYPETDIPPIVITKKEIAYAEKNIPKSWDESIGELQRKYKINPQLSEQIFDSRYIELFERIVGGTTKVSPTFVASVLCSSITNLERSGLDSGLLSDEGIARVFELLEAGEIAKESVEIIFEDIMAGKSKSIKEAMKNASIETVGEAELEKIIEKIVEENQDIIKNQEERAVGPLMGIVMKELRGKASGETINKILLKNIRKKLDGI